MNLDDLMAVWRTQDAAPLHDVNKTLLHLALRQDEAKLQKQRRLERWMVYIFGAGVLVGMGVLPLQFEEGTSATTLKLTGEETFDIVGLNASLKPQQTLTLRVTYADGTKKDVPVRCRIDTPIEIDYYQHGGILPFVLRQLVAQA